MKRQGIYLFVALLFLMIKASGGPAADPQKPSVTRLAKYGVENIIFANRKSYKDGHWYANIGYWCDDDKIKMRAGDGGAADGRLCRLNLKTGKVSILVDAGGGSVRDPRLHYDAKKLVFSWRKDGTEYYNLYEINVDGTGLKRLTNGEYDDIEPCYLPDGGIAFISTRCNRWVQCYHTQVAVLHRCDADGKNITQLSSNIEHDNTPSVLHDGRILHTRWEYVDRSQIGYHHLWTMNPDGSGQMVFYGNQRHFPLYIATRPIPGSDWVVGVDCPGHGRKDHYGFITLFSEKYGPDDKRGAVRIPHKRPMADPYPLSDKDFLVAQDRRILLLGRDGKTVKVFESDRRCYEPIPLLARKRERVIMPRTNPAKTMGQLVLTDVYNGRNMKGVKRGDIKKLLVLEVLPKPVNFSGGMDVLSWLGTFTLERALGTVPVEEDGSASFELPANRPVFFVALDENEMSVKRMQSFVSVAPGEVTSCVGCHENRMKAPASPSRGVLMAMKRAPSKVEPFEDMPFVIDYNRDIQPIWDRNCLKCHSSKEHKGSLVLEGDLGKIWGLSWYQLFARKQIADGRNGYGNQAPRTLGSSASPLMKKIDGSHYKVKLTDRERRMVWLWVESAAPYVGSYSALRNPDTRKLSGGPAHHHKAILARRCASCHDGKKVPQVPFTPDARANRGLPGPLAPHERRVIENDPLARYSIHVILNYSRPELSRLLLAPLAKAAGGWGSCGHVFMNRDDPDYKALLVVMEAAKKRIESEPRYSTPGFKPNWQYVREMKKYGILPKEFDLAKDKIDVFEVDERYWKSFWYTGIRTPGDSP